MSVASVFINKAIFKVYNFRYPFTLVLGQTIFTLMLLITMRNLRLIRTSKFQFSVFKRLVLSPKAIMSSREHGSANV
ncbi:hypothetical protein CBR_g30245 [Chara braunii]|uniref:Uncharacterized protein n=1 Tax=Chara braunii TaxID=69332 RepID=A0A388LCH2_CHABU|nr:hypothetical protein CBR_g30245 [Chara braunii]|eukprot:GBG79984.1 hypothetical protein CBR_g30245 [Chara braunii]